MASTFHLLLLWLVALSVTIITVTLFFYAPHANEALPLPAAVTEKWNAEPNKYLLAIVIMSQSKAVDRRDTIRNTWLKDYIDNPDILIKFSIGINGLSKEELRGLGNEQLKNNDLMLLKDLRDAESSSTKKVLSSFKYIDNYYLYSYLLKCDDNTFVALDMIVDQLQKRDSGQSFYWGKMNDRIKAITKGDGAEPKWVLGDFYLPHASSFGYILSSDLVQCMTMNSEGLTLYNSESVAMGVWVSPYKIERRHDDRFRLNVDNKKNCSETVAVPLPSPKDILSLFEKHTKKGMC